LPPWPTCRRGDSIFHAISRTVKLFAGDRYQLAQVEVPDYRRISKVLTTRPVGKEVRADCVSTSLGDEPRVPRQGGAQPHRKTDLETYFRVVVCALHDASR
jgi:hypothetical protein